MKTAALTNNWLMEEKDDEREALKSHFDAFIESSRTGLRKPDPRIYELTCEALGVLPGEAAFLDDIGANLKTAARLGMLAIKVTDPDAALRELGRGDRDRSRRSAARGLRPRGGDRSMTDVTVVATGLRFPEGPIALSDGSVLVVEIARGAVSRVLPDGAVGVVAETGGGPNGMALGPDGRCYVCNNGGFEWREINGQPVPGLQGPDYEGGRIEAVDLETGEVEVLYRESDRGPLRGPNDIVFDAHGGFWFTDFGKMRRNDMDRGFVHYARADGSGCREVIRGLTTPNGIGLSPDGGTLYVAETIRRGSGHGSCRSPGSHDSTAPPARSTGAGWWPRPGGIRSSTRWRWTARGTSASRPCTGAGSPSPPRTGAPSSTFPCPTTSPPTSASAAPISVPRGPP